MPEVAGVADAGPAGSAAAADDVVAVVVGRGSEVVLVAPARIVSTCRAPGDPSELDSPPEGDGRRSSAWAIPLANPTTTQVVSKNAATVNRNHQ